MNIDVEAGLRKLLDAATPPPWEWTTDLDALLGGEEGEYRVIDTAMALRSYYVLRVAGEDAELITVAVNALPALLDELGELREKVATANRRRDDLAEARDNARDEADRQTEILERVWALHAQEVRWQYDPEGGSYDTPTEAADDSCCDCSWGDDAELAHTPECLARITSFDICYECGRLERADADRYSRGEFSGYDEALWPCATIRALEGTQP